MNIRQVSCVSFIILILGLYIYFTSTEGFISTEGFVDRCGVDIKSCSDELRCMNGYCKSDILKILPTTNLKIIP